MDGALVLLGLCAVGESIAYSHIRFAGKDGIAQCARRLSRIGVVSIDHKVTIGLDIAEHLTTYVAFTLTRFEFNSCPVFARDLSSALSRVVVVDVDRCFGKLSVKIINYLCNG